MSGSRDLRRKRVTVKEVRHRVSKALARCNAKIETFAERDRLSAGMASEGYDGGYAQALRDALCIINGFEPDNRGNFRWEDK